MEIREFITQAFQAVLGRNPSTNDFEGYTKAIDSGWTRESVLWDLLRCEECKLRSKSLEFVPTGHFYSAVPSMADRDKILKGSRKTPLLDVDLRPKDQEKLLKNLAAYMADCPFEDTPKAGFRYHFVNPAYCITDGFILYAMLRHFKPKRVIEIGSGYSSALMLDVRQHFLPQLELTYIEPYANLLKSLFKEGDSAQVRIHEQGVQEVDQNVFRSLQANDILFIDSTHVAKLGSDVNHLFFQILPLLAKGVIIHIHDIFYPFEYPKSWIKEGRAWNELYLLRAFLMNNKDYSVLLFNSFIHQRFKPFIETHLPKLRQNHGGSIWLRKNCRAVKPTS